MESIFSIEGLIALATLSFLEIILGIDNLIFISILVEKVEASKQRLARNVGLGFALVTRILLLLSLSFIMRLTEPLFGVLGHGFSGRDIILLVGGLFLIGKATSEIHEKIESMTHQTSSVPQHPATLLSVIIQIGLLDIIFSLDSVITAVGMVDNIYLMITAICLAMGVMVFSAKGISSFISKHPTFKMLALSFLVLIGMVLVAEGFGEHVNKGYIYFAIGFSLFVEVLNMKIRGTPQKG